MAVPRRRGHTHTHASTPVHTDTHTRDMHLVKKEGKNETAKRIKPKRKKEKKIRRKKGIVTDLLLPPMARSIFHHVIAWQCLTGGSSAIDPCPSFWFSFFLSWNKKKKCQTALAFYFELSGCVSWLLYILPWSFLVHQWQLLMLYYYTSSSL